MTPSFYLQHFCSLWPCEIFLMWKALHRETVQNLKQLKEPIQFPLQVPVPLFLSLKMSDLFRVGELQMQIRQWVMQVSDMSALMSTALADLWSQTRCTKSKRLTFRDQACIKTLRPKKHVFSPIQQRLMILSAWIMNLSRMMKPITPAVRDMRRGGMTLCVVCSKIWLRFIL